MMDFSQSSVIQWSLFFFLYATGLIFLYKLDRKNFLISIPLSLYAFMLGGVQIVALARLGFPYLLWIVFFYVLFSLFFNSVASFLHRYPFFFSILGGFVGMILFSFAGKSEEMSAVWSYVWIFFSCFIVFFTLFTLNRRLIKVRDRLTDELRLSSPITIIFDGKCSVCSKEMCLLKKRKQTGKIIYAAPQSDEELKKITEKFSYEEAMKKIHAIDAQGNVFTSVDVLSEMYARTDLPLIAIFLEAPCFKFLAQIVYVIWAKFRPRIP